mgnify:CR=1 FL=1
MASSDLIIADAPNRGQAGTLVIRMIADREARIENVGIEVRTALILALRRSRKKGLTLELVDGTWIDIGIGAYVCASWHSVKS